MFAAKRYLSESSAEDVDDPGSDPDQYKDTLAGDTNHYKASLPAAAGDGYGQFKRARMSQDSVESDHHNDDNSDHNEANNDLCETETVTPQSASINKPGDIIFNIFIN